MNYWELQDIIKSIIPRRSLLEKLEKHAGLVKEKGRKSNYSQFNLETGELVPIQRLLNKDEINSFLEVSLRAAHCPMPLNVDLYDALQCPYRCQYCFADAFRASLYTSFFDNSKNLGLRSCNPSFFRPELDKIMKHRGKKDGSTEIQRAINLQIPIRLGIRFEDFLPIEGKKKICLDFLTYLRDEAYPVMINTKSSLIGREDYVRVLIENEGGSAVHITAISADDELNKILEPGAPPFMERVQAIRSLTQAGIRVVARIEPFMVFLNDKKEHVDTWINAMQDAGVQHITLDTYSWSASAPGIRRQMEMLGIDFDRIFLLMSDSQWLGSLLLSKFIEYLQPDFYCSTFDFGNVPYNSEAICCCVGDYFEEKGAGFNWGSNVIAIRKIVEKSPNSLTWGEYDEFVESKGGWLSETLRRDVFRSWNLSGNPAYFLDWAQGVELYGQDKDGNMIWRYIKENDFRLEMLEGIIYELA